MKTAFVTGGTGFVGSHLAEHLLASGYGEVRCLVRSDLKWLDGLPITPIHGDLHNADALRQGLEGVDHVYHVAALTRHPEWPPFYRANVLGTLNVLDAVREVAPGVRKVLITSSLAAVGASETPIATEDAPLRPVSRYGRSKAEMETALAGQNAHATNYYDHLPLVVVRPPAVYGPRETNIFTFFHTVSRGLCPIVGNGRTPDVSLVHVQDLVRGMVQAAEADSTTGRTYFIGSDRPYSWNDIKAATTAALGRKALTLPIPTALVGLLGVVVEGVGRLFGQDPPLNREKAREIQQACKMCATDRARRDFGYCQEIPLEAGLARTIAWYKKAGWL